MVLFGWLFLTAVTQILIISLGSVSPSGETVI